MTDFLLNPSNVALFSHGLVVLLLSIRVIMKRPATGVALAWVLLIVVTPLFGALIYLLIGERRIGSRRAQGIASLQIDYKRIGESAIDEGITEIDWTRHSQIECGMDKVGRRLVGFGTVRGSSYNLFSDTQEILSRMVRDIDAAESSVLMEFYIWHEGGAANEVLEAVVRAAERGVHCCLLIDALGARPWWKSNQPNRLREAGVNLLPALPVGLFRTLIGRTDLRLHRKIVVIDGHIAWTGSMNMVDPRFFKQEAGVGQWIDAMVRLQGSVVVPLAATIVGDWMLESQDTLDSMIDRARLRLVEPSGEADMQVIPSGPGQSSDAQLQMILALINTATEELVMTTPYLVPDESLLRALRGAAARGVIVRLIVPESVDSLITRYASRSCFDDLLDSGIEIYLFRGGLLHTKSITADSVRAMFGTVNLDFRSLWLNYEVALYVYDSSFSSTLRGLQHSYIGDSDRLHPDVWSQRSLRERFLENSFRLASPLL